jgi:superfamily I DNA and/or RNA helicase
MDIERFVENQLRLIEVERRAEIEQSTDLRARLPAAELERRGLCLLRLRVEDVSSALGGRCLLRLAPISGESLPATRVQPGDIVSLTLHKAKAGEVGLTGVVFRMSGSRVQVALDEDPDDIPDGPVRIDRVANDVTYRRIRDALRDLRTGKKGPARRLREILFGQRDPGELPQPGEIADADYLNESQREAVSFALSARDVALIHGPPGTGKTTAVVDLICRAVARKERVLACAPSNIAVDNMAERLARRQQRIVRLGHPARLLPEVVEHSLDALIDASEQSKVARTVRRDLERAQRRRGKARSRDEKRAVRDEVRALRSELIDIEKRTIRDIISSADVVLATITGCADSNLRDFDFDLVVIDEAAQALECSCWIALLKARRAVLAGDHLQLSPTILSREAEKKGLGFTLFDRLTDFHDGDFLRMLKVQYRMNENIMNWSSVALYGGELEAHESVRSHVLADLDHVEESAETTLPLLFIDTAGCDFDETTAGDGGSKSNVGEAEVVGQHLEALIESGVRPDEIAIVTPYNAQVQLLRARLRSSYESLEIDTVDGFQGREKEAIILSLVRSNSLREVGFLADRRRLNVAVTRARRHVAVIADSATISNDPFLSDLITYFETHGEYRSAWEYR